jgi:hypothetical protein
MTVRRRCRVYTGSGPARAAAGCVWCAEVGQSLVGLPVEPCNDCLALVAQEMPEPEEAQT